MMSNRFLLIGAFVALGLPAALSAADTKTAPAGLSATQIVDRHVAARGGLQAWHAVQTMSWSGKMDAGVGDSVARSQNYVSQIWGKKGEKERLAPSSKPKKTEARQVQLPFVLEVKRPGKSRVELDFAGKTAIQVFDGNSGWMMRPFFNRDH